MSKPNLNVLDSFAPYPLNHHILNLRHSILGFRSIRHRIIQGVKHQVCWFLRPCMASTEENCKHKSITLVSQWPRNHIDDRYDTYRTRSVIPRQRWERRLVIEASVWVCGLRNIALTIETTWKRKIRHRFLKAAAFFKNKQRQNCFSQLWREVEWSGKNSIKKQQVHSTGGLNLERSDAPS